MKRLGILIADDHEVVREGLRRMLENQAGWRVVGEAVDGKEAVQKARQLRPDIVILDISMPGMDGLEATGEILKAVPSARVLILTVHDSEQAVRKLLRAGARGYVLKSDAGRQLVAAVEAVAEGNRFLAPKVEELVLDRYLQDGLPREARKLQDLLTPREVEITRLLADGKSNKEIASVLGMSVRTAEAHRSNIMSKVQARSLGALIRYAIRSGIVEP